MFGFVTLLLLLCTSITTVFSVPLIRSAAHSDPPTQIHISQGDFNGTGMTISWITNETLTGEVRYGLTKDLNRVEEQSQPAQRYNYTSQTQPIYFSGYIHHVTLSGLQYETTYYYQCGDLMAGASPLFTFVTPPAVGANSHVVINFLGDLGQTKDSNSTLMHIKADDTAHITVLVGDLSYADSAKKSTPSNPCGQQYWDTWGQLIQPVYAYQPLMVLAGNHEVEQMGGPPATQTQFLAYTSRFFMPAADSEATEGNLYYSFAVGPAVIFMLNSYIDYSPTSTQYKWFTQRLAKIDRSTTPWVIVALHAPWYNSNTAHHDEDEATGMRATMEPLLYQYKVDICFAGHVHAYERTHPVYNNVTTPGATTYITIGDGGNREGPASTWFPTPSWSAFHQATFGHGRLEFFNASHASWEWHRNPDDESVVSDSVLFVHNSYLNNGIETGLSAFPL